MKQVELQLSEFKGIPSKHTKGVQDLPLKDRPKIYYSDYLMLDRILDSQFPLSEPFTGTLAHDEILFIIIHQTYELWFKQILHEVDQVVTLMKPDFVPASDISHVVHNLHRVIEIVKVLIQQINVLETMSAMDFMDFRDYLFPASGFQSFQFRLFENKLGTDPERRIMHERKAYHTRLSEEHARLVQEAEKGESLFSVVERWLERFPFFIQKEFDFLQSYKAAVQAGFQTDKEAVYQNVVQESSKNENVDTRYDILKYLPPNHLLANNIKTWKKIKLVSRLCLMRTFTWSKLN